MKRVAATHETAVGIEVIVEPVVVQLPTLVIEVQVHGVPVAVRAHPDRNMQNIAHTTAR